MYCEYDKCGASVLTGGFATERTVPWASMTPAVQDRHHCRRHPHQLHQHPHPLVAVATQ